MKSDYYLRSLLCCRNESYDFWGSTLVIVFPTALAYVKYAKLAPLAQAEAR